MNRSRWLVLSLLLGATVTSAAVTVRTADFPAGQTTCKVQYPQVAGLADAAVQTSVNEQLAAGAQEIVETHYGNETCSEAGYTLEASTTVPLDANGLLSLQYILTGYMEGAAHPDNAAAAWTFDTSTGKLVQYADLFQQTKAAEKRISEMIQKSLVAQGLDEETSLLQELPEGFGFYLSDKEVVLINLFDIHALSGLEANLPLSELKDVVAPEGPLSRLLSGAKAP